jgi:hypothetical protein
MYKRVIFSGVGQNIEEHLLLKSFLYKVNLKRAEEPSP